ncbi:MAG: homocysteine S-methyltransferase family protein [Desulfuromonadales bacterium]|nr:homocysteine S-methyltransferase family protein [Desulfuromonadales bacterium]MBN2792517.1 homocysteine S-methyltransferase family protein [Desulfuromonadales bacterium]
MTTHRVTILDGGMGRELERRGAPFKQPEWSALAMMEAPQIVTQVHKDFIAAGARVITTNSYALVPFHIREQRFRDDARELAEAAGRAARQAVGESRSDTRIAGCIPPLFGSYRADLYQPQRVDEIAVPLIKGLSPYVDIWLCETQSLIAEPVRVKDLLTELNQHNRPFWVSFTLEDAQPTDTPRLRSGETVVEAVAAMVALDVEAILFNCCQPEVISAAIQLTGNTLQKKNAEKIQIGAYANAFPPQPKDATANAGLDIVRADLTPEAYLDWARQWQREGATLIGGCCGIGPTHIALLAEKLPA